ncbi:MAG: hypothetical protein FWF87_08785 [Synergistaceae bacterium]|nr:hypothetical protein [Synergistaceae bacterium]
MKKTTILFLCVCVLLAALLSEAAAYPGVKRNAAFGFTADRVAKINSGGFAGGVISDEMIEQMSRIYRDMDIDATIIRMKEAGRDERTIENTRKQLLDMKKMALEGTLGAYMRRPVSPDETASNNAGFFTLNKLPASEAMEGYKPDDWDAAAEWALLVAADMATAMTFGGASAGLMNAAGLAVTVYPHPLVLNNYASLLGQISPIDALFFYLAALEFEPHNPVILTNIGMTYLDMGNYGTAKEYALIALQYNPECGPAYQILTACHLKDGNSVLAAETLFKSTRDCFDEMTMLLFRSYFDAIDELDYREYDFPINEVVLELMYETARKFVDTVHVNESIDTPTNQLTIDSYPDFGDGEGVMLSYSDYHSDYSREQSNRRDKLGKKRDASENRIFYKNGGDGTLALMHNLRQYYAYLVLEKYYDFQHKKKYHEWHYSCDSNHEMSDGVIIDKCRRIDFDVSDEFEEKFFDAWKKCVLEEMSVKKQKGAELHILDEEYGRITEEINKLPSAWGKPDVFQFDKQLRAQLESLRDQMKATKLRYDIRFCMKLIADNMALHNVCKEYAVKFTDMDKAWYNECKQLMEEFWLKAGGILKYMTDPDVLEYGEASREKLVVDNVSVWTHIYYVRTLGGYDKFTEEYVYNNNYGSSYAPDPYVWHIRGLDKWTVDKYYKDNDRYQEAIEELQAKLSELVAKSPHLSPPPPHKFDGSPVEVENNALQQFKDPNAEPEYEFSFAGYYYHFSSDGDSWELPILGRGSYDNANDSKTIYEKIEEPDNSDFKPLKRDDFANVRNLGATTYDVATKVISAEEMVKKAGDFAERMRKNVHELDSDLSGGGGVLERIKPVAGAVGKVQNYIGFAQAAADVKTGGTVTRYKYVTKDSRGRVVDRGDMYERQVGGDIDLPGDIGSYGLERTTTVRKSKMTGVAAKNKTLKHKFTFGGVGAGVVY